MGVIGFEQKSRVSYASGVSFGRTGQYEQIDGVLTFAVDPSAPANRSIHDLGLAPRDENGLVRFKSDLSVVRPVDSARGSRTLLIELPNRGRRRAIDSFNQTGADPSASPPPGDGFLFEHGVSVASIGWQWDVYRDDVLMGLEAPLADVSGEKDRGQTVVEIRPNERRTTWLLADRVHIPLKASDLEDPKAVLYVRDHEDGKETVVPRSRWRFARETSDGVEPSSEHIYLEGGFEPGKCYQVVYSTGDTPIAAAGLLAFRDVATFLRHDSESLLPGMGQIDNVIGYGVSQTGRMIRHFLYHGLNTDELGRKAYDGLLPHVAGARRGSFNHRHAQPSNQSYPNYGHMFPFADAELVDPLTETKDGLLSLVKASGHQPKIFYTNSSAEYWRGDCSLMTTDPPGLSDVEPDPHSRVYHFAGTQHGPGSLPQGRTGAPEGALPALPYNVVDYTPLLRAALVNLVRWVADGVEPPPGKYPRLSDGTAVERGEVIAAFGPLPGVPTPDPSKLWVLRTLDMGPRADEGVASYPPKEGAAYRCLVSAVDEDGNELAGIRLPDVSRPVATHTGWNTRAQETGAPDQQVPMIGFSRWFPASAAQRQAEKDPRRSIEERYGSREEYESQARSDAQDLVEAGYVLEQDLELVVRNAVARYDYALEHSKAGAAIG